MTFQPGTLLGSATAPGGLVALNTEIFGVAPRFITEGFTAGIGAAFTAMTTGPTLWIASLNVIGSANANLRISGVVNTGITNTNPFHVRLWARRKPGVTTALSEQTIILKGGFAGANTLGKIYVGAVAAGNADPVSTVLDVDRPLGDTLFTWTAGSPVTFTLEFAEPALEMVYQAYGQT